MADVLGPTELVERFIARPSGEEVEAADLLAWMKSVLREGGSRRSSPEASGETSLEQLAGLFPRVVLPDLDYTTATALVRTLGRLRKQLPPRTGGPRIAVVGSFTTHQLVELFDLYLHGGGVDPVLYEASYGTLHQELLDPESGLHRFRPDFVVILTTWRDLGHRPLMTDDRAAVDAKVRAAVEDWVRIWSAVQQRLGCQILQNNFDAPPWRTLGNLERRHAGGLGRFVSLVNHALQEAAPPNVNVHDVDHLASTAGRLRRGRSDPHRVDLGCRSERVGLDGTYQSGRRRREEVRRPLHRRRAGLPGRCRAECRHSGQAPGKKGGRQGRPPMTVGPR